MHPFILRLCALLNVIGFCLSFHVPKRRGIFYKYTRPTQAYDALRTRVGRHANTMYTCSIHAYYPQRDSRAAALQVATNLKRIQ